MNVGLTVKEIYLEDIIGFLKNQKRDGLLDDYYEVLENKTKEAAKIKDICESVVEKMDCSGVAFRFEKLKEYPCKSYDGRMLMKIFIVNEKKADKDSSPKNVCDFIKLFSENLQKKLEHDLEIKDSVRWIL